VDSLNREVGRDQSLVGGGNAQDGAIVADTGNHAQTPAGAPADAGNQRLFVKGHGDHYIESRSGGLK